MNNNLPIPADPDLTAPVRGASEKHMEFVRLLATTDLTQPQAAKQLGVHYSTAHGWLKKNPDLKERVEDIMRIRAMAILEDLMPVVELAAKHGLKESWDEYKTIDAQGGEHLIREHQKAPDIKAIMLLIRQIQDRYGSQESNEPWSFDLRGARDKPELEGPDEIEDGEVE